MTKHLRWIWRALWTAALVGITFVAVLAVVADIVVDFAVYQADEHVEDWTPRGELAGDEALLDRAEQVWRDTGVPVGDVEPVYAGRSSSLPVNVLLVALAGQTADDRPVVAFVTSAATAGDPSSDQLFVRALSFPEPYAMAVGFVAARQEPSDSPIPNEGSLAFALSAPGVPTMMLGSDVGGEGLPGEIIWRILPRGAGAWNSGVNTYTDEDSDGRLTRLGAGVRDHAVTAATVSSVGDTITARYDKPAAGDLIVNSSVLVGVVTDASGRVDIAPITQAGQGRVRIRSADVPGVLKAGPSGTLTFTPTAPSELKESDQVLFTTTSGIVVRLGWLSKNFNGEWDVGRGVFLPLSNRPSLAVTP